MEVNWQGITGLFNLGAKNMLFSKVLHAESSVESKPYQHLATLICFFCLGFSTAAWAPLIPFAQQRLHLNHADFGSLLLCGGLGSMIAMPATGLVIQKLGCKRVIAFLLGVLLLTLPSLTLAPNAQIMAICLFIFGSAAGGLGVAINLQAVIVEKNLSRNMMSSFHGMCSLGGLLGVMGVTVLLALGVQPLASALLISVLMIILTMIAVPQSLNREETGDQRVQKDVKAKKWVMPKPLILVFGVMCFIAFLSEGSAMDWSGIYLVDQYHMSHAYAGLAYTCFAIAMTIGRFSGQWIQRQLGEKNTIMYGAGLAALGMLTVVFSPIWLMALIGYLMMGLGCSNIVPLIFSQVGRQQQMPQATALSYVSSIAYSGSLLGPALIGFCGEAFGLMAVFIVIAMMILMIPMLHWIAVKKS